MGWPKKQQDSGDKLYAKKDEIIRVQLLEDEPELYYTHFLATEQKTVQCSAPDCAQCQAGNKRNEKGKMKVRDMSDKKEKLMAGSSAMFQALHEVVEMAGSRSGFIFAIKRTGEKTATRYNVTALPLSANSAPAQTEEQEVPF